MPAFQSLPWIEPLELAAMIDEPYWVLLYSGVETDYSRHYSILACQLAERVEASDFLGVEQKLSHHQQPFDNAWFGYLGYGLKDTVENLTPDEPNWLTLPNLCMMRFHTIYQFDHAQKRLTCFTDQPLPTLKPTGKNEKLPPVTSLRSPMRHDEYLRKAAHVIEAIHRGDLYQANLTRKFIGSFAEAPDCFSLFKNLCTVSPAAYSAYVKLGDTHILSSSPELFLHADATGRMRTRPIKGTAPRYANAAQDAASSQALAASAKDQAENLMIVDLMRNDLSRSCIPGSVQTDRLFEVTSHATIHHMSSTVTGQKRADCSTLNAVKACFPPGSMTGAPKIKAMNLCSELERYARGIYSGALGWLGGDGSAELSVVIRTLIMRGKNFEFQTGGGIVADSTPEGELKELLEKSKGILKALNISPEQLEQFLNS